MMRFRLAGATGLLAPLATRLVAHGATESQDSADLILVGATTLADARTALQSLEPAEQQRVVLVGLDESFELQFLPHPDSLAALLERFRVLGSTPLELTTSWDDFGIVARKDLVTLLGCWFGTRFQSPHYAAWAGLSDFTDAAAFWLRLVEVAAQKQE
jgi:hypothetical protein